MAQRRILILSFCLLLGYIASLAGSRTEREMLAIAQRQLQAAGSMTRSANDAEIRKLSEDTFYAIYGSEKGGFAVISRDDSFEPVLGYSATTFRKDAMPCGLQWWLNAINESMENRSFTTQRAVTRADYTPVAALCKTVWGQGDPYNYLTPELKGQHTPTGCVATAMSQIMKYFSYPAKGKGKGYYTTSENPTRVTETINSVYQWEKMQDTYSSSSLTDDIRMPIATLMKDAGLATNMTYGTNGSGALSVIAARGFAYNFSYDSLAIHCYYRDYFNETDWMNTIYSELSAGRPILYTGVDSGAGGHAFVFDGIDADGKIHVNWGWDGTGNGFYDIADLNPTDERGKPGNNHFNKQQSMLYGFKCQENPDPDEHYTSLWCSQTPYELSLNGKILEVKSGSVYNYNFLYFYGVFGLFFDNQDGNHEQDAFLQLKKADKIGVATFFGYDNLDNTVFISDVPEGHYRLYLASKAVNENNYQPVRCPGGVQYYDIDISAAGITMSEAKILGPSTPTGITTVTDKARVDDAIYTLQGQKVQDLPSRHGIYIQNGKKYVK